MKRTRSTKKTGFTLVELLTTLAVVGILLALLIPALTAVQKTAISVKQKAQFHTIGLGLEAFRSDRGDYPPSEYGSNYGNYTASQRLAEAMVGRDGLGFHPDSVFNESGWAPGPLYRSDSQFETYYPDDASKQANLNARLGPYLELESANAVQLGSIYGTGLDTLQADSFVLVDMFRKVKHLGTGKQTGMPILYYRANRARVGLYPANPDGSTYNVLDSIVTGTAANTKGIVAQSVPFAPAGTQHPLSVAANFPLFYNAIANPNFNNPVRPYRSESFILHSAGPDGLYGTIDDVFNFDAEK